MPRAVLLPAVFLTATVVIVLAESQVALAIALTDGLLAGVILLSAALPGSALLRCLGKHGFSSAETAILGTGLGVGLLCLLPLGLGLLGRLTAGGWLLTYGAVLLASLAAHAPAIARWVRENPTVQPDPPARAYWLLLVLVPFVALTLLVATAPPGTLWAEEGGGYDVLEYHLGVPKEYLQAGRIRLLAHNVYSNFPFNAEMLYLTAFVLRGPVAGILPAQMFNAQLALLTVIAAGAAGRWLVDCAAAPDPPDAGARRKAGIIAAVLMGSCGWLVHLSGVAYAENAMLFFTTLSLAAAIRAWGGTLLGGPGTAAGEAAEGSSVSAPGRACRAGRGYSLLAGVFAGLACGCKYTALPLVAIPVLLGLALPLIRRPGSLVRTTVLFVGGILLTFGPWLFKNAVFCGNPVFPLAAERIGHKPGLWGPDLERRWVEGHRPPPHARDLSGRVRAVISGVILEPRTGIVAWLMAALAAGMAIRCRKPARSGFPGLVARLAAIVGLQVLLWAALTHLAARFAVAVLPPLYLLAAAAAARPGARRRGLDGTAMIAAPAAAVLSLYSAGRAYYHHTRIALVDGSREKVAWFGQVDWFLTGQWPGSEHLGFINGELPPGARVLMVGDARPLYVQPSCGYCVVFSPNPLADAARRTTEPAGLLKWLAEAGWTHVHVDWSEMARLRATYGFWPEIDESLFVRLERAGLKRLKDFRAGSQRRPYATIYEVPR